MPIDQPSPERPRVVRPAPDASEDEVSGLPQPDGDLEDESETLGLDDDEEDGEPEREASWLDDDEAASELETEAVDELEGEDSAMDDAVLAIDDDPLETDPEARFSEGSEAEGNLDIGDEDIDAEAAPLGVDDGAEGMGDEASEGDDGEGVSLRDGAGDELASDLLVAESTLAIASTEEPRESDEPVVGLCVLDAELVLVRRQSLTVGRASHPLPLGDETLVGAAALDEDRLLVWTDRGSGYLFDVLSEALQPIDSSHRWTSAASDRRGGAWVLDPEGFVRHLGWTADELVLAAPEAGRVPGARRIVAPKHDPALYLLSGRAVTRLLGGQTTSLDHDATAIGLDRDGALLVARDTEVVKRAAEGTQHLASAPQTVDDLVVIDRALLVLSAGRARFVEGRDG